MSKDVITANHCTQIFYHRTTCHLRSMEVKNRGTSCSLSLRVEVKIPTKDALLAFSTQLSRRDVMQGNRRAQKYEEKFRYHCWKGYRVGVNPGA
mmetsp:Transcript_10607/g.22116  ORF Transcript_10607/g.22116 Transcript_10607/m.22116 type:complete len:94 (+) Transcript_10607:775-1056(+)